MNKSGGLVKSAVRTVNYYLFLTKAEYDMPELDKSKLENVVKDSDVNVTGDTLSTSETAPVDVNEVPSNGSWASKC